MAYYVTVGDKTITINCYDPNAEDQFVPTEETYSPTNGEPAPVHPVPSRRQLLWQETEFYAFFHFGMNTFTNSEWGNGGEAESRFAPTKVPNPKQWLTAVKAAGMKGGIAVVKHHDGFCLWPTETTTHSVVNAGNANGRNTNIPEAFAAAARELDMKYGFYVSPWDLNSKYWGDGTSDYVNKVFLPQCLELAKYGSDQFEMWFDGATGGDHAGYYGGANTTRTIPNAANYYDIPNLRDTVHAIAPNCVMWGVGDEARWIGNEQGWAGETNWAMGSGESGNMNEWKWKAGESDAKATDKGWFWHSGEKPKTAQELFKIYLETVGRNATLILNFPPDQSGELPAADVTVLEQLGTLITDRLTNDKAKTAKSIAASATRAAGATRNFSASNLTDDDKDTYWATDDSDLSASITLEWDEEQSLYYVMLMEYIKLGQRVKEFTIETSLDGQTWTKRAKSSTTTIGYKRIVPLNGSTSTYSAVKAKYLRITIDDARGCPTLHTLSVF
ncbi:MAG: alpha-L-fucosidase [Alloprevotella sp.]|nr:alpha-L-fucosidase [Alloprevotella sp.]MBR1653202.1 alpha-L-fucosidase [Alloprevotella sp.]